MGYIKKTFKDKNVIKALIIVVISCTAGVLGYMYFKQQALKFIFLFGGSILMFLQFPVISNTAMKYAEEEEKEKQINNPKQVHHKKKK